MLNFFEKHFTKKFLKESKKLGNFGEWKGVDYFNKKGYELIAKNVNFKNIGEIDLIFKKKETLLFVEVKTRKLVKNQLYKPEDSVNERKKQKYYHMSKLFLKKHNIENYNVNFLTLAIEIDENFNIYFREVPF